MQTSVEYLGHIISAEGLRPTKEKVHALLKLLPNVCVPTLVISQVGELLPEVNYYTDYSRRSWDLSSRKLSRRPNPS